MSWSTLNFKIVQLYKSSTSPVGVGSKSHAVVTVRALSSGKDCSRTRTSAYHENAGPQYVRRTTIKVLQFAYTDIYYRPSDFLELQPCPLSRAITCARDIRIPHRTAGRTCLLWTPSSSLECILHRIWHTAMPAFIPRRIANILSEPSA